MRSDLRAKISDKELVKDYISETIGDDYTPKTIAVLASREDSRSFNYPDTCVIKPTHSSGQFIIRSNGLPEINYSKIDSWFDINYYYHFREINYRSLKPKVIVEELLTCVDCELPKDYKFFCICGCPVFIAVNGDRLSGMTLNYFSPQWCELDIPRKDYTRSTKPIQRPLKLDVMLRLAEQLASDFSFVRVDFYEIGDRVLVGELTNLPDAAAIQFSLEDIDLKLGKFFEDPTADIEKDFALNLL